MFVVAFDFHFGWNFDSSLMMWVDRLICTVMVTCYSLGVNIVFDRWWFHDICVLVELILRLDEPFRLARRLA